MRVAKSRSPVAGRPSALTIVCVAVAVMGLAGPSWGQEGVGNNFAIEGNLFANSPAIGPYNIADDWLPGPAGPGAGVMDIYGIPIDATHTWHVIDGLGNADMDIFEGGDKYQDDPRTWGYVSHAPPDKDEIHNGLLHFRTDMNGHLWAAIAGDREDTNGESYIDFSFLQNTMAFDGSGGFISEGPDSGRTVGDLLLTIHLTQGGSISEVFAEQWGWDAGEGAFRFMPVTPPPGTAFVHANKDSAVAVPYGAFGSDVYQPRAFGEAIADLTEIMGLDACQSIATVFIKTKSSTSDQAQLKDMIEPIQVNLCLDEEDPMITVCPTTQEYECDDAWSFPSNDWDGFVGAGGAATDNCDEELEASYVLDGPVGTCPKEWTLTWTVTDDCGNTDTCDQLVYEDDTTAPVITTCPGEQTYECSDTWSFPSNDWTGFLGAGGAADDNCSSQLTASYVQSGPAGTCPKVWSLTWTVNDECGNPSQTCDQLIYEVDTTAPVISTCPPTDVHECGDPWDFPENSWAGFVGAGGEATDNCHDLTASYTSSGPTADGCGKEWVLTWTVDDGCGNTATCEQLVQETDTTAPVVQTCPPTEVHECTTASGLAPTEDWKFPSPNLTGFIEAGGEVSDNCDTEPDATYENSGPVGSCPTVWTLTWTITDDCGNSASCEQIIMQNDTVAPRITCPDSMFVQCAGDVPPPDTGLVIAEDDCDTDVEVTHVGDVSDEGSCPETIARTYRATDDCGNTAECTQYIVIDDTTPPVIATCPPTDVHECGDTWDFPENSLAGFVGAGGEATDNCEDLTASYTSSGPTGETCSNKEWVLTWTVEDGCGNTATCEQLIQETDTTPPVVQTCPPTEVHECSGASGLTAMEDWRFPSANLTGFIEAGGDVSDNCDTEPEATYENSGPVGSCPTVWTLTWTITDDCGNSASCQQRIEEYDTIAPVLECAPDDTVLYTGAVTFTPPTIIEDCDPSPKLTVISTTVTPGSGGETLHTRCWVAEDSCGNVSAECCQSIVVIPSLCGFTQGGWGSGCPYSQVGDPLSTQPGCVRDHYFDQVFPNGVTIGDPSGVGGGNPNWYASKWTSAAAVEAFLPADSGPGRLTEDFVDPVDTPAGVLAGQILALVMTREYSCAGVLATLDLAPEGVCYGDLVIPSSCAGKFEGLTIDEFLAVANLAVAGKADALTAYGASLSDVNFTATCLNELFDDCEFGSMAGSRLPGVSVATDNSGASSAGESFQSTSSVPAEFEVRQVYPNPFTHTCNIQYGLPRDGRIKVEIFDVAGRLVAAVLDEHVPAGYHTASWDGRDTRGSRVASGIYFYRVRYENKAEIRKMIMMR